MDEKPTEAQDSRAAAIERYKQSLRERVATGYYPAEQISGPPLVTASESIDD